MRRPGDPFDDSHALGGRFHGEAIRPLSCVCLRFDFRKGFGLASRDPVSRCACCNVFRPAQTSRCSRTLVPVLDRRFRPNLEPQVVAGSGITAQPQRDQVIQFVGLATQQDLSRMTYGRTPSKNLESAGHKIGKLQGLPR